MNLTTPIENISGVGPILQKKLQRLGIRVIEDLLFYFPSRYEDFSQLTSISKVKLNQNVCISGKVLTIQSSRTWKKKMLLTQALIEDKTGAIEVVWFNQPYLSKVLKKGDKLCLAGKVSFSKKNIFLSNPSYEKLTEEESMTHTGRIIPIYPETAGLSSRWLRFIVKPILEKFKNNIPEILPDSIVKENNFLPSQEAIQQIHFPESLQSAEKAKARFAFEELFLIEISVLKERMRLNKEKAPAIPMNIDLIKKLVSALPFRLTNAQRKCAWQILKDLEKPKPMSRLLEGDVGSGKTLVAIIAGLNVVKAGYQAAFMAPTEILAKQHFQNVSKLLKPFKIKIGLLTGKEDKIISQKLGVSAKSGFTPEVMEISRAKLLEKARGKIRLQKLEVGIDILIGTHSLIQDEVKFGKLGLVIIDEQHRFGVEQRARLCQNHQGERIIPHLLSMTATPIPRTLALTIYGDLDLSVIDEMPKGRKKTITKIIPPEGRKQAYDFIRREVREGKQVFVICPRIESDSSKGNNNGAGLIDGFRPQAVTQRNRNYNRLTLKVKQNDRTGWSEAKAVKEEYEKLSKTIFPDLKVAMLHGKMKLKEKEKIMKDFKSEKINILVSTSVVEVGVDIPKATVMMIEGSERFGLAQLHQFRGRVGRSDLQSYCFLFTDSPGIRTRQRLKAIISAENGFELAQKDLEIRGPGSLYGAKQWGIPDLAMENLKNIFLVEKTREAAKLVLQESPDLNKYPILKKRLERFQKRIHLE